MALPKALQEHVIKSAVEEVTSLATRIQKLEELLREWQKITIQPADTYHDMLWDKTDALLTPLQNGPKL